MCKRRRVVDSYCLYRRQGTNTIYARDRYGRYNAYQVNGQRVTILPGRITTLPPIYGRVNFANNVRFTGRTRNQGALQIAFEATPKAQRLSTGWVDLPQTRASSRRETNQGMNAAMIALTGVARSATNYVIWFDGLHPGVGLRSDQPWEWCHLLAHSMGGADDATNIVAARKGNNSEQLAIESALQMYRMEQIFQMKITAACLNGANGRHIGNVIRYKIRCIHGGQSFIVFLDCLNAPDPSQIHYYGLLESVARWANNLLIQASMQIYGNAVTADERRQVLDYIDEHG